MRGPLNQCFSTSGPQDSLGGPLGFSHFIKNQNFRQKCHKNYFTLSVRKASRSNKVS